MSCDRNNRAAASAATKSGIPKILSQASNIQGALRCRMNSTLSSTPRKVSQACLERSRKAAAAGKSAGVKLAQVPGQVSGAIRTQTSRVGAKVAPLSNTGLAAANWVERNGVNRLAQFALLRYALKGNPAGRAVVIAQKVLPIAEKPFAAVGSYVGTMAQKGDKPDIVQSRQPFLTFFYKNQSFALYRSALSPLLNRQDVMVPARQIKSSRGATVNIRGKTWHRGTTTFTVDDGRERTITHIQSLSAPSQHYYFDRSLSNRETVDITGGKRQPAKMNGFVGQVTPMEGLTGSWSSIKHAAIKNYIHHPPPDKRPGQRPPQSFMRVPHDKTLDYWARKGEGYDEMLVDVADTLQGGK